jgi:osmoprotectant transport system substrate-binding protein
MARRKVSIRGGLLTALLVPALLLSACGQDKTDKTTGSAKASTAKKPGPKIVVGAQDFNESKLLAQIYADGLSAKGFDTEVKLVGGNRKLLDAALSSNQVNFTPEYAASLLEYLNENAGEATADIDTTMSKLVLRLAAKKLVAFNASTAQDTNALAVTKATAAAKSLTKISELQAGMRLGGPQDCLQNPFCIPGLKRVYGIDLSAGYTPLDSGGPTTYNALTEGSIDVAVVFSTTAANKAKDLVLLADDKGLFNADNVVPITTRELEDAYGDELSAAVDDISLALTTDVLLDLNDRFETKHQDVKEVAAAFLDEHKLR